MDDFTEATLQFRSAITNFNSSLQNIFLCVQKSFDELTYEEKKRISQCEIENVFEFLRVYNSVTAKELENSFYKLNVLQEEYLNG